MKLITITGNKETRSHLMGAIEKINKAQKRMLSLLGVLLFAIAFVPTQIQAQAPTLEDYFDLPDAERCTSKDLHILTADLVVDNCNCVEGELQYVNLKLGINNTTSSERTSFAFWSRLTTTDPDTMEEVVYFITGCTGPILPSQTLEYEFGEDAAGTLQILDIDGNVVNYPGTLDPLLEIPYVCGTTLELTNIYEGWTDASDNEARQCPLDPSKINPKCDVIPTLTVGVGLSASSDFTDVNCYGGADGTVTIEFSGGTAPYMVNFNSGGFTAESSPKTYSGLAAGTYNWIVKDSSNPACEKSGSSTVGGPTAALSTTETHVNVLCYGGATGSIDLSPSGGTPPYAYAWTASAGGVIPAGQASNQDLTGLVAGTYDVVITDANGSTGGCMATKQVVISQPAAALSAIATPVDVLCYGGATGSIDLTPAGGTPPYSYEWTGPDGYSAGTQDISGLEAGSYSVTVTDDNDCTETISGILVGEPDELVATVTSVTNASCAGFQTGAIDISVVGGTPPYTYEWSNGATTQDLTAIGAGTYSVTVTDDNGCEDILEDIMVDDPSSLEVTATTVTNVSCFGFENGAIDITVTGGTSPYTYLWSNGATTQDVSGLEAGTYWVTVTDSNLCEYTLSDILVGEPTQVPPPVVQVAPFDFFQTSGSFGILNAPADYEYSLDGGSWFSYTGTITDVSPGPHTLVARDANECESEPLNFDIPEPFETPAAPTVTAVQPDCDTLTGSIIVTSGTIGFMFSINDGPFVAYPMGGFTGLAPGNYTVRAESNDGCISDYTNITLEEPICDNFTGCTLGYWKNHTDRWCDAYETCDIYGEIFAGAPSQLASLTLQEVLNLGGGGIYNLGRQSVAALLNACSDEVNYELATPEDVIAYVIANFGNAGAAGSYLDMLNQRDCPLGGSKATTAPSDGCDAYSKPKGNSNSEGFSVSPVPFRESLNVQFDIDYVSDAVIQMYDMQGRLLSTHKEANASKGKITNLSINFRTLPSQVYVIKVTTDRDVFTKKIISDK